MKAENYGGNNEWEGYMNMVDLGDFTTKAEVAGLLEKYPQELYNALDKCVAYQVKGVLLSGANGLSCYYSYNYDRSEFDRFARLKGDHSFRWLFHYLLYQHMPEDGMAYMRSMGTKYDIPVPDAPPFEISDTGLDNIRAFFIIEDGEMVAEIDIGNEEVKILESVHINLICPCGKDGSLTIFGTDYLMHEDWENGVFYEALPTKWAAIDGVFIYLEIKEYSDHNLVYDMPVLLNGELYALIVGYLFETKEYEIEGARHTPGEDGIPIKELHTLMPGDVIEPLFQRIDIEGTEAWEPIGIITVTETTCIEVKPLPDGFYYVSFTMTDILHTYHTTDTIEFRLENGKVTIP